MANIDPLIEEVESRAEEDRLRQATETESADRVVDA
jgi:hypothetical protein